MASAPWYAQGLRFACTRCGRCCVGAGTVRVSDAEIARLARRLTLSDEAFRAIYVRRLRGSELSLREKSNTECVFYEAGRGCRVYEDRPRQCRSWPFWSVVLHSRERWEEEAESCPGMNRGPLHDAATIDEIARDDGLGPIGLRAPGGGGCAAPAAPCRDRSRAR